MTQARDILFNRLVESKLTRPRHPPQILEPDRIQPTLWMLNHTLYELKALVVQIDLAQIQSPEVQPFFALARDFAPKSRAALDQIYIVEYQGTDPGRTGILDSADNFMV